MFTHIALPDKQELKTVSRNGMRFYQTPHDLRLPSITTVLSAKEKPWLKEWQTMLGKDKAKKETDRCAKRGDSVHLMCEKYIDNFDADDITKGQDRSNVKLFNQIKLALNKRVNNVHAQEVPLYSETLGVAGRTDLIAEYDGVLSVVDFKTSNNNKTEDMIEDYFLQSTAYALMFYEMYGIAIKDIVIVMAVEKGMMPLVFKKKIDDYVEPLMERIDEFYKTKGKDVIEVNDAV